jgi:GAF domain-containing protein|tara:strand:- start:60 stop:506 length:447 start_codon:yes stop_codon:yes gene_type:complete
MIDYEGLTKRVLSLTEGEYDQVSLMATVVCEVHWADDRFDWTGFYRVVDQNLLKIGPYQGSHGCLTIPFSRGVCGAAARTGEIQLVSDVSDFSEHIACSASTQSELVVPVRDKNENLIAVFDIDSNVLNAFNIDDANQISNLLTKVFK